VVPHLYGPPRDAHLDPFLLQPGVMSSALPVAGYAIIEAATLAEAIEIVSRTPCAVAHGVVEVWPLQESP